MADKAISELVAATAVGSTDLFVLEQTGTAKKLTGQILENWLVSFADGHGGIQTVAKTGTSGLVDTYTITYADTTTSTFTVTNGKALTSITQYWAVSTSGSTVPSSWSTTRQAMTATNKYLWSYMTFNYNDGTSADSTKSVVGVYGDTGAQTYVWIKYAAVEPTSDADMGDTPDNWIGIYTGLSSTAPTSYTAYAWYEYKGEKGDTGDASTITSQSVTYQEGTSGTIAPSGTWTPTIPTVTAGNFLWTRTVLSFNDGSTVTAYSVARFGIDGTGAVSSVNSISPDTNGNVALTATNIPTSDNTSIQSRLEDIEDGLSTKETEIKNRRFLYIGDSYEYVTSTRWTDVVDSLLGLSNSVVVAQGGYAFVTNNNKTWLSLLQNTTISNEDTITDILICGGTNDAWGTQANIPTAIETFDTYIKQRFSGLKNVWLGFAGNTYYGGTVLSNLRSAMRYYVEGSAKVGWRYLSGIETTLLYPSYMQKIGTDDYHHPNETGVIVLGRNVAQCVKMGSCVNYHAYYNISFNSNTSQFASKTFVVAEGLSNNDVSFQIGDITLTAATTLSGNLILGTCAELKNMLKPLLMSAYCQTSSGSSFIGILYFADYTTLRLILPSGTSIGNGATLTIHGFTASFDMLV